MLLPISPNILVGQGNILRMPLALGQVFIFGRRDCFCQTQNSSNYSLFEWFCYHDLGQILANMDFHAHTWPRIESTNFFIVQKNFPNVNVSIWPIYKVMNVHWLKSMKYSLKMEFWVHLSSWKMKTFWCFLAKCWPRCFFNVVQYWKLVRNDIWVLPHTKNYNKDVFWPRFGQKTSNFQLSNCFYQHGSPTEVWPEKFGNFAFQKVRNCFWSAIFIKSRFNLSDEF